MSNNSTLVHGDDRLDFLPMMCGKWFNLFESNLYRAAEKYITDYNGGYWHFHKHGDAFWLTLDDEVHLTNPENYFDEIVSGEDAGMAITLLLLNQFVWYFHEKNESEAQRLFTYRFYALRNYMIDNDKGAVSRFID